MLDAVGDSYLNKKGECHEHQTLNYFHHIYFFI